VRNLNLGALPVPIKLISSQTIGATLGDEALKADMKAGAFAFAIIALFLILWYRLPGLLATFSLAIYVALNLAIFKLIPVTLTAAGIAGLILSIGMAVDANILIFERMKEELRKGSDLQDAVREGFHRAWPSIRDSNISSIITGVILYFLGSSAVITGFALVFIIGVLVSMFTAITVSRTFLLVFKFQNAGKFKRFLFSNGFSR
jgi:protein-export membrane protein SecD